MKTGLEIPGELRIILKDKVSGSNLLRLKLALFFIKDLNDFTKLKTFIPYIKSELKAFAGITSFLKGLEKQASAKSAEKYLQKELNKEETTYQNIFNRLYPHIKNHKRILTFSNSKTVYEILALLKKPNKSLTVVIAESRPVNEGRMMAKLLARQKIRVEFITEAMLPEFIEKCDSVILGADQILKNGDVVNKTGSRMIALLCKEFKKPVYIVADKSKRTNKNAFTKEKKPAKEVWNTKDPLIKVHNYYFERVEKKYITKVIID